MIIAINRLRGNRFFTVGELRVPGTEFKCMTLELRAPEHSGAVNKRRGHAVPCDDYRCITIITNLMSMTPRTGNIKGHGRAILVDKHRYQDLTQGQISICATVSEHGVATTHPSIAEALSKVICEACDTEGETFSLTLSITEDDNFCYDADDSELAVHWDGIND